MDVDLGGTKRIEVLSNLGGESRGRVILCEDI